MLTRALFLSGLLLLGIVLALVAIRRGGNEQPTTTAVLPTTAPTTAPSATTTAPAPTATAPTTTAPTAPVQITSVTPFSVTVAWHTDKPTTGRLAVALAGGTPTLWSAPSGPSVEHSATVGGLAFATDYQVSVAGDTLGFRTTTPPASLVASTGGGSILLDGQPFFPLIAWGPARATTTAWSRRGSTCS